MRTTRNEYQCRLLSLPPPLQFSSHRKLPLFADTGTGCFHLRPTATSSDGGAKPAMEFGVSWVGQEENVRSLRGPLHGENHFFLLLKRKGNKMEIMLKIHCFTDYFYQLFQNLVV